MRKWLSMQLDGDEEWTIEYWFERPGGDPECSMLEYVPHDKERIVKELEWWRDYDIKD